LEVKAKVAAQEAQKQRGEEDFKNDDKAKRGRKPKAISEVPADSGYYRESNKEQNHALQRTYLTKRA